MDPYQNKRNTTNQPNPRRITSGTSAGDQTPDDQVRDAPDGGNPPATDRQPQYSSGYTMIPPIDSRRSKITTMAQKELEDLQRWKEANKPPALHLNPEKLGGNATLAGARAKQLTDLRCAKLQKTLKKEEDDKRKRQEEEEENQKMKDKQREKAERLEEKRRQDDQRRKEQFNQDHVRKTESFLQRFEKTAPGPLASSGATHTSCGSEAAESKPRELRSVGDLQLDHRRVNLAFLDNLEGRSRGSEKEIKEEGDWENPYLVPEDLRQQPSDPPGQLNPEPEQSSYDWTQEVEPEYDWALMRLISSFPDYSKVFLEDILDQCDGDYQQAYTLLISALN